MCHLSYYGKIFFCDGLSFQRIGDIQYRTHVVNHTADIGRKSALRYAPASHLLDQGLLITRRIKISHFENFHIAAAVFDRFPKRCDFFLVCAL